MIKRPPGIVREEQFFSLLSDREVRSEIHFGLVRRWHSRKFPGEESPLVRLRRSLNQVSELTAILRDNRLDYLIHILEVVRDRVQNHPSNKLTPVHSFLFDADLPLAQLTRQLSLWRRAAADPGPFRNLAGVLLGRQTLHTRRSGDFGLDLGLVSSPVVT